jgi:hypothetical protein
MAGSAFLTRMLRVREVISKRDVNSVLCSAFIPAGQDRNARQSQANVAIVRRSDDEVLLAPHRQPRYLVKFHELQQTGGFASPSHNGFALA